jgi:PAS domain S-box-containing protein
MKIKTQLIVSGVVFSIILLVIAVSVATTEQQVAQLRNQESISGNIERGASDLNSVSIDYFLYQQDIQVSQWQSNLSSLSSDLSNLKLNTPQQQTLANKVSADLQNLNSSFEDVVSFLQNASRTVSVRIDPIFQQKWSNMAGQGSTLASDASELSSALNAQSHQANETNAILIVSLVGTFGAFLATIYVVIFRRTLKSVAELQNGINTVSSGNLDYVIETKRQDEVSELSYYFNQMTANRKLAEKKLLAASLYARSLIESSLDPLVTISPKGKITDVNQATEDVTGYSREQLVGSDFSDYFTKPEKARTGYKQVFTDGFVKDYPLAIRNKSGKITYVLYNASIYRNAQGTVEGVFAAARDITERKRAEEKYQTLFNSIDEGFSIIEMVFDPDGKPSDYRFLEVNESFERQTGLHDAKGKLMRSLAPNHEQQWFDIYGNVALTGQPIRFTNEAKALNRWYDVYAFAVGEENPRKVAILFNDISTRKTMENDLTQTLEKLKQSNAELEQFAYVASHDLQEPLRMVASYVQLIERRYKGKLDSDADEFIGYAVDGANRMRGLIDDLLTYSRVARLGKPFEPTNLESTFEIVAKNLQASIKENNALVTHDKLPVVVADSGQMVQLFQNLIGNAIKFHGKEAPHVHISAKTQEADYLFSIRDNGIGIDPQYFDRLFKIFQRLHTKQEYPGSGIGLVICKRIVERHGGRIWLESQVGKGSTIHFTLRKKQKE